MDRLPMWRLSALQSQQRIYERGFSLQQTQDIRLPVHASSEAAPWARRARTKGWG